MSDAPLTWLEPPTVEYGGQRAKPEPVEPYERLPEDARKEFEAMADDLFATQSVWQDFEALFVDGKQPAPVALLDRVANTFFFHCVKRSFYFYVVLGICRLTDPPEAKHKGKVLRRLGFRYITGLLALGDPKLAERLTTELEDLKARTAPLRAVRDNVISHLDRDTAMGDLELDPVTIADIRYALERLYHLLNLIGPRHLDTSYAEKVIGTGVAQHVVAMLKLGVETSDAEYARMLAQAKRP